MKTIVAIVIVLSSLTLTAAAVSTSPEHSAQGVAISTPDAALRMAANELSKTKPSVAGECNVICALPPVSNTQ